MAKFRSVILDAGPLVAYLDRSDFHHLWARQTFAAINGQLICCEPVLTEAFFLLQDQARGQQALYSMLNSRTIDLQFTLKEEVEAISKLMTTYIKVPMSLADACLVRMSELHSECPLLTLDSDFQIYRRFRNQPIQTIDPTNFL